MRPSRQVSLVALIALAFAAVASGAGLVTGPVRKIRGELAITSPGGQTVGKAQASVVYSAAGGTGAVRLEVMADGRPLGTGRARLTADRQEVAAGAVVALVLAITRGGDVPSGSSLVLFDVEFDGDVDALRQHAVQLMDWWDAKGRLTYGEAYVSPVRPTSASGRLQFNLWSSDGNTSSASVVLARSGNTVTVVGGLFTSQPGQQVVVTGGTWGVVSDSNNLGIYTLELGGSSGLLCEATLHMLVRADGMVDVRGHSDSWCLGSSASTLEGEGDTGIGQILLP